MRTQGFCYSSWEYKHKFPVLQGGGTRELTLKKMHACIWDLLKKNNLILILIKKKNTFRITILLSTCSSCSILIISIETWQVFIPKWINPPQIKIIICIFGDIALSRISESDWGSPWSSIVFIISMIYIAQMIWIILITRWCGINVWDDLNFLFGVQRKHIINFFMILLKGRILENPIM